MKKAPKSSTKHYQQLAADWRRVQTIIADTEEDVTAIADDVVEHSLDMIKDHSDDIQKSITKYIAKHPLHVIGIAFIIGAIIGTRLKR